MCIRDRIKTSALIGLGALGILFGRKMPGVQVIADEDRSARYSAEPDVYKRQVELVQVNVIGAQVGE